jgi:hypothetical protein
MESEGGETNEEGQLLGGDGMKRLTVKVDLCALGATETTSRSTAAPSDPVLSQKAFYNSVIRSTRASIEEKIAKLNLRRNKDEASQTTTPQKTNKTLKRKTRGTVDPFDTAVSAFEETYTPLVGKDVYRWDVFVTRLRGMVNAFGGIVAAGSTNEPVEDSGVTLTLVILESQLLQKCLGATWHALLRLNEMVRLRLQVSRPGCLMVSCYR